jgi:AAA15 family ATPase/GTPase
MFLKNITVNKYRSIQHARADFENGLNIIIGKNGVGKSNLLKYIDENVDYGAIFNDSEHGRTTPKEFEYTFCYDDAEENQNEITVNFKRERIIRKNELGFTSNIKLTKRKNDKIIYQDKNYGTASDSLSMIALRNEEEPDEFDAIRIMGKEYVSFELPKVPLWLSSGMKYEYSSTYGLDYNFDEDAFEFSFFSTLENILTLKYLGIDFSGFVTVIGHDEIKRTFQESFEELKADYDLDNFLSKYSPIESIRLNPNINTYYADNKILIENLIIEFRINNSWVPWSYLSDGTKRLFYLITQCLGVTDGIVLIEEPELGIHPHQLHSLMQFIYEQSRYKQIIISTHSPIVLDVLSPDDLHRITIAKLTPTGSQFYKLTEEQKDKAREYMEKVGELSYYWLHSDLEDE